MALNLTKPLRGNPPVSRGFASHVQTHPGTWYGIDYAVVTGTDLIACETGYISHSVKGTSGGGWSFILHFDNYPGWMAWYAHCSQIPGDNQRFNRGQVIGKSGATGGVTGPHLHFSILHQEGSKYVPKDPDDKNIVVWEGGDEPMITDADNEYGRWNKLFVQIRGRHATRDEFRKHAVGKSWLQAMETLSDDAEADRATKAQEVGAVAVRDNWEGQIKSLNDEVTGLRVKNSNQEMQLVNLDSELKLLRVQVKNQDEEIVTYQKDNDNLTKKVAELEKKVKELSNQGTNTSHGGSGGLLGSLFDLLRKILKKGGE
jgi:septal ring factor EnvC (AmiA/AmiB activator)